MVWEDGGRKAPSYPIFYTRCQSSRVPEYTFRLERSLIVNAPRKQGG